MRARISLGRVGGEEIELDGQRVEHGVRGLTVRGRVGQVPEVTLDLLLIDGTFIDGEAHVTIPEATRQVLITLGWTPP